jgi:hypothetical protein
MSQQMSHGCLTEAGTSGDQLIGAQVVVRGGVEVDKPLLPQLHHGYRCEGLSDGGDPKNRVLGDGCVRLDVRKPMSVEERKLSVADYS